MHAAHTCDLHHIADSDLLSHCFKAVNAAGVGFQDWRLVNVCDSSTLDVVTLLLIYPP